MGLWSLTSWTMSRLSRIKKDNPELLEDLDFKELVESADTIHDIKGCAESKGGKALIKFLLANVVGAVHVLSSQHPQMSHTELVAVISKMATNLATARFLTTAKGDVEALDEQIADMLRQ